MSDKCGSGGYYRGFGANAVKKEQYGCLPTFGKTSEIRAARACRSIILVSAAYIALTERTERVRPQRVEQNLPPLSWGGSGVQTAYWVQEAVQPGDSLADVLARSGMARDEIARITEKYGGEADLRHLRADQSVHVLVGGDGGAREVQFFTDEDGERNLVALEKKGGIWRRSASEADMKRFADAAFGRGQNVGARFAGAGGSARRNPRILKRDFRLPLQP